MTRVFDTVTARTPLSSKPVRMYMGASVADRALRCLPGGSNGEFALPRDLVTAISHGRGSRVWNHAGQEMLDFSMGWGTALVGHAHPGVVQAVQRAVEQAGNFAALNVRALELAERLIDLCPAVQRLRFCASGTEATGYAVQLARAFTHRPAVLKFSGAYHGANAIGTAELFPKPGHSTRADAHPAQAGITSQGFADDLPGRVFHCPFNDAAAAAQIIAQLADRLAAVIVEPLHRCTPPKPGFLQALAKYTKANGSLLVFDEVVTGFRLALGGAQSHYGLDQNPQSLPDLVAYGKALGGGMPIGVIAGRADVMELVNEHRMHRSDGPYVWFASSLGGNPVSCSAAHAALDVYEQPDTYPRLHALGEQLRQRIAEVIQRRGLPAHAIGDGPMAQIAFNTNEAHQSAPHATTLRQALLTELFRRGVFVNPMGTKLYLSLAHTQADLDIFTQRFDDAAQTLN